MYMLYILILKSNLQLGFWVLELWLIAFFKKNNNFPSVGNICIKHQALIVQQICNEQLAMTLSIYK